MARKIPLPVEYIVFYTDYTGRIPDKKAQLLEELQERELDAQPLYVNDTRWGINRVLLTDDLSIAEVPRDLVEICQGRRFDSEVDMIQKATDAVLGPDNKCGTIAFRAGKVNSFQQIFPLYDILHDLHYCKMFGLEDIQIVETTQVTAKMARLVRVAVVTVGSESG